MAARRASTTSTTTADQRRGREASGSPPSSQVGTQQIPSSQQPQSKADVVASMVEKWLWEYSALKNDYPILTLLSSNSKFIKVEEMIEIVRIASLGARLHEYADKEYIDDLPTFQMALLELVHLFVPGQSQITQYFKVVLEWKTHIVITMLREFIGGNSSDSLGAINEQINKHIFSDKPLGDKDMNGKTVNWMSPIQDAKDAALSEKAKQLLDKRRHEFMSLIADIRKASKNSDQQNTVLQNYASHHPPSSLRDGFEKFAADARAQLPKKSALEEIADYIHDNGWPPKTAAPASTSKASTSGKRKRSDGNAVNNLRNSSTRLKNTGTDPLPAIVGDDDRDNGQINTDADIADEGPAKKVPRVSAEPWRKSVLGKAANVLKDRRMRVEYTEDELDALFDGVRRFGLGSWAKILKHETEHQKRFHLSRNSVALKDKWRSLSKQQAKIEAEKAENNDKEDTDEDNDKDADNTNDKDDDNNDKNGDNNDNNDNNTNNNNGDKQNESDGDEDDE